MIDFDADLLYTKSNEWAKRIGDVVRMGIDDYSQSSLGDIVHAEFSAEGAHVDAGKPFGAIEATKSVTDVNSPVTGVISRINPKVLESPAVLNIDPFGEGWIAEIMPDDFAQLDGLMSCADYKKFILSYDADSRKNPEY